MVLLIILFIFFALFCLYVNCVNYCINNQYILSFFIVCIVFVLFTYYLYILINHEKFSEYTFADNTDDSILDDANIPQTIVEQPLRADEIQLDKSDEEIYNEAQWNVDRMINQQSFLQDSDGTYVIVSGDEIEKMKRDIEISDKARSLRVEWEKAKANGYLKQEDIDKKREALDKYVADELNKQVVELKEKRIERLVFEEYLSLRNINYLLAQKAVSQAILNKEQKNKNHILPQDQWYKANSGALDILNSKTCNCPNELILGKNPNLATFY
jgi:hypothetical protein